MLLLALSMLAAQARRSPPALHTRWLAKTVNQTTCHLKGERCTQTISWNVGFDRNLKLEVSTDLELNKTITFITGAYLSALYSV